jgi:hypothetical protein
VVGQVYCLARGTAQYHFDRDQQHPGCVWTKRAQAPLCLDSPAVPYTCPQAATLLHTCKGLWFIGGVHGQRIGAGCRVVVFHCLTAACANTARLQVCAFAVVLLLSSTTVWPNCRQVFGVCPQPRTAVWIQWRAGWLGQCINSAAYVDTWLCCWCCQPEPEWHARFHAPGVQSAVSLCWYRKCYTLTHVGGWVTQWQYWQARKPCM